MDDLTIKSGGQVVSDINGQYKDMLDSEENYHLSQFTGGKLWKDGWLQGIETIAQKYFTWKKYCSSSTDKQAAIDGVTNIITAIYGFLIRFLSDPTFFGWGSDVSKYLDYSKEARCWIEKNAKKDAKLTDNVGGLNLECAYAVVPCESTMSQPSKTPTEMFNDNYDEISAILDAYLKTLGV